MRLRTAPRLKCAVVPVVSALALLGLPQAAAAGTVSVTRPVNVTDDLGTGPNRDRVCPGGRPVALVLVRIRIGLRRVERRRQELDWEWRGPRVRPAAGGCPAPLMAAKRPRARKSFAPPVPTKNPPVEQQRAAG